MFQRAVRRPEGEYEVNWNDYYLFHLVHFAKHWNSAGCGPRAVLDVYLFLQAYGNRLEEEYLQERLKQMGLSEFRRNVEQVAEYWFAPHEEKMELTDGAQELANGMLGSAVYGTQRQMEENLLREHRGDHGSVEQAGLRYLWRCIFLPRKNMEVMYPILRRHPALLPACWLVRGGRMVFATPGRSIKNCRAIWRAVQRVKKKEQTEKKK